MHVSDIDKKLFFSYLQNGFKHILIFVFIDFPIKIHKHRTVQNLLIGILSSTQSSRSKFGSLYIHVKYATVI